MYFDEAHSLLTPFYMVHNSQHPKTLYDVMLLCLEDMRTEALPIFLIFLSTNSDLQKLAPPAVFAMSAQMMDPDAYAQAPITELPFDCFCTLPTEQLRTLEVCPLGIPHKLWAPIVCSSLVTLSCRH